MYRFRLTLPEVKRRAPAAALIVFYVYLGFHAFSGSQGLVSWMEQSDRADRLEIRLAAMESRRAELQARVDRLSADGLDLDTLDIEARRTLFVSRPDEITIWLDP